MVIVNKKEVKTWKGNGETEEKREKERERERERERTNKSCKVKRPSLYSFIKKKEDNNVSVAVVYLMSLTHFSFYLFNCVVFQDVLVFFCFNTCLPPPLPRTLFCVSASFEMSCTSFPPCTVFAIGVCNGFQFSFSILLFPPDAAWLGLKDRERDKCIYIEREIKSGWRKSLKLNMILNFCQLINYFPHFLHLRCTC